MYTRKTTTTVNSFLRHSELAEMRGELNKAVKFCETALAIEEAVQGPLSPHLLDIITRLLDLYKRSDEHVLSVSLLDRVTAIADANPTREVIARVAQATADAGTQRITPASQPMVALDQDQLR